MISKSITSVRSLLNYGILLFEKKFLSSLPAKERLKLITDFSFQKTVYGKTRIVFSEYSIERLL